MDLATELENRYERNEDAFEHGKISHKMYIKNSMFFQAIAKIIESNRDFEMMAVDLQGETFIRSLIRELADYNLTLSLTSHGEARISPKATEDIILETLHKKKDWVHEILLLCNLPENSKCVLDRLTGINIIAQKKVANNNFYKING